MWQYPLKFYVARLHMQHALWPAGGSKAPLLPSQTGHSLSSESACPFMLLLPVRLSRDDSAVSADFINAL